jgi:hypothetical protein
MSEWDNQYRRWAELMDREALGEMLSADDTTFCERFAGANPASRRELELLEELEQLDAAPSASSRAIVDGALARLAAETAKVEHEEVSQLKSARMPRVVWFSGAAAAAAVGLALWLLPAKKQVAVETIQPPVGAARIELMYSTGDVRVDGKPVNGLSVPLAEGSTLAVGDGSACLAMDPGIDVCTKGNTQLRLSRTHSIWRRLDLESGKVAVQLVPQPDGWRFSIVADGVWSTAVGTAFTVEHGAAEGVRTTVLNGKVRVGSDGGREQIVTAHQRAHVHAGTSALEAVSRSDESPEWALLRPASLWSNPVSATLQLRGVPANAEILLDAQAIGEGALSTVVPAGAHSVQVRVNGVVTAARDFTAQAGQLSVLSFSAQELAPPAAQPPAVIEPHASVRVTGIHHNVETPATAEPVAQAVPAAAPSAAEMLAEAHKQMRASRFDEAAAQYQALRQAYPDSAEARTVLVSLAELQVDRLGSPDLALRNLDRYLEGGNGALVEEARRVRIRALRTLGNHDGEASAIEEFLAAHPKSFQAPALRQRMGELKAQP